MTMMVFVMQMIFVQGLMIIWIRTAMAHQMAVILSIVFLVMLVMMAMRIPKTIFLMKIVVVQVRRLLAMTMTTTAFVTQMINAKASTILLTMTTMALSMVAIHVKQVRLVMMVMQILKMMFSMRIVVVQVRQSLANQIAIISQLRLVQIALLLPI